MDKQYINIALPKGRSGEVVYEIFEKAGYGCPEIREGGRKLIFENTENAVRFFYVKPSDVAIYVERGAADLGAVGRDILLEHSPDVYELLDFGVSVCRMSVSGKPDTRPDDRRALRVATKFPHITREHFSHQSRDIDIIKLNGSIELAPIVGLSDVIVDIVETGSTLRENGLVELERIVDISARLIANKAAYKFKYGPVSAMVKALSESAERP